MKLQLPTGNRMRNYSLPEGYCLSIGQESNGEYYAFLYHQVETRNELWKQGDPRLYSNEEFLKDVQSRYDIEWAKSKLSKPVREL